MAGLLARAGETVHVIAHRWTGAPLPREEQPDGRLIVHRVGMDEQVSARWGAVDTPGEILIPRGLLASSFPSQAFSWQAAVLAERLIESDGIDVIEAQEWEAPLYYLQLRRALGLGPSRRPPCVVHIHSPSEQIYAANQWDTCVADYAAVVAMEEYSIRAADAVLCPSQFVAAQVLARYGIDRSRLTVIAYPLGDVPYLDRPAHVWATGSICHIGRLELRKGVIEWAEAVGSLAMDECDLSIEFIGQDTPVAVTGGRTVGDELRGRIPRPLQRRFRFLGATDRSGVIAGMGRAWAAVVPSRWENYPYSCIESMSSGLPVIASPNGGMRELVADGVSGWIAEDGSPAGLARALRRALGATPADRRRMGDAAAETVRRVCGNDVVVRRHVRVKAGIVQSSRSAALSTGDARPWAAPASHGIGVVVTAASDAADLRRCLDSIRAQTHPPRAVRIVHDRALAPPAIAGAPAWSLLPCSRDALEANAMTAADTMRALDPPLRGVLFVDARCRLAPRVVAASHAAMEADPHLGVVAGWIHEDERLDRIQVQPSPAVPYIWRNGEDIPIVAIRMEAIGPSDGDNVSRPGVSAQRRLLDRAVRAGWKALTYPAIAGSIAVRTPGRRTRQRASAMARAVRRLHTPLLLWLLECPREERLALLRQGMRSHVRSMQQTVSRTLGRWNLRRFSNSDIGLVGARGHLDVRAGHPAPAPPSIGTHDVAGRDATRRSR